MFDRAGFAAATKKGIGLPIAGAAFWIAASVIGPALLSSLLPSSEPRSASPMP